MVNRILQDSTRNTSVLRQEAKDSNLATDSIDKHNGQTSQTQPAADRVTLSEEARNLAKESQAKGTSDNGHEQAETSGSSEKSQTSGVLAGNKSEEESGTSRVEQLRKQIEEIKKKLQEAQARLAQAQASGSSSSPEQGQGGEEAAMESMASLAGSAEAEAIQAEIKALNQQLALLNDQLLEAMKGEKGSAGGAPSLGPGAAGGDSGGLGERLSVTP